MLRCTFCVSIQHRDVVWYVESPLCYSDGDVMHQLHCCGQSVQSCSDFTAALLWKESPGPQSSILCQIPGATMRAGQDLSELCPGQWQGQWDANNLTTPPFHCISCGKGCKVCLSSTGSGTRCQHPIRNPAVWPYSQLQRYFCTVLWMLTHYLATVHSMALYSAWQSRAPISLEFFHAFVS